MPLKYKDQNDIFANQLHLSIHLLFENTKKKTSFFNASSHFFGVWLTTISCVRHLILLAIGLIAYVVISIKIFIWS